MLVREGLVVVDKRVNAVAGFTVVLEIFFRILLSCVYMVTLQLLVHRTHFVHAFLYHSKVGFKSIIVK